MLSNLKLERVSVASGAVKNKREREKNRVELCYTACPSCIDLDARDCDRERERSVATFSDGLSYLTQTYCGYRKENWTVSICERVK